MPLIMTQCADSFARAALRSADVSTLVEVVALCLQKPKRCCRELSKPVFTKWQEHIASIAMIQLARFTRMKLLPSTAFTIIYGKPVQTNRFRYFVGTAASKINCWHYNGRPRYTVYIVEPVVNRVKCYHNYMMSR